ncbi:FYDLN acid domain-containing protein [Amaricoccus tamworthensis]|uniref:FYDLN acid domain-containing protein n=1 Tax=Amaricoccus tamworthensis TaxID=57002 RepID=UPI003C7D4AC4
MPKEEWGVKRVCPSCATRFYDLNNDPMTCPSCQASFTVESLSASKPKALRPEKEKTPEEPEVDDMPDIESDDDDIDDDLLDDDDDTVPLETIADVGSDDDDDS